VIAVLNYKNEKYEVLINDEDLVFYNSKTWRLKKSGDKLYVSTPIYLGKVTSKFKWKHVYYHREILDVPKGMYVDHIDGNTLNNLRSNLRICSNAENCRNQKIRTNNKTGYRGVRKVKDKFIAQINKVGKATYLGQFKTIEEAVIRYNSEAVKEYGEYAKLNIL
jgi:hypothetical protein